MQKRNMHEGLVSCCSAGSNRAYIEKQINIKIPDILDIESMDSHGGFHGDGKKFIKIKFNDENALKFLSQLKQDNKWNEMPLSENLNLIMYGGIKNNFEYGDRFAEKLGIPEIKNGYWYFIDRHSKSINPDEDTELLNRYSVNFALAMYDADNNILYFFELDT